MNNLAPSKFPLYRRLIIAISIVIPLVVGALFRIKLEADLSFLPPIYAGFNGATALLLISALVCVKRKKIALHRMFMRLSLLLSLLFLVCYVAYHLTSDPTLFGDLDHDGLLSISELNAVGSLRMVYYIILISHIGLSMLVIPMVLFSYLHAWSGNFDKHKKWVRFSYPIWLYVATTGVVVYLMIAPYY
jgi:putative membrane protein